MTFTVGVTGGTGFIGKKIIDNLVKEGINVISLQRSDRQNTSIPIRLFDLSKPQTLNDNLVKDIDVIIHTAALVHDNYAKDFQHDLLNREASSKLFNLSLKSNVKKFIFISTVGVYGVSSSKSLISLETPTDPVTPYAKAKRSSEIEILDNSNSNIKTSVFRLPLVIGLNAPGNYGFLEKISNTRLPLPFGLTANKRSVVTADVVAKVITEAAIDLTAFEGLQLIAESCPLSTKEMIVKLRMRNGNYSNLIPIPKFIMKLILLAIGRKKVYEQLYEDLVFTSSINIDKYMEKNSKWE